MLRVTTHDFVLRGVRRSGEAAGLRLPKLYCKTCELLFRLLNVREGNLGRRRASEDADHNLERLLVFVDVVDCAVEVRKRAFGDAYLLALGKLELELGLFLGH